MVNDIFEFADALGPCKVIHVHEPSVSLKATLVIDNTAKGPALGGLRMAEDVSVEECFRLARAMTFKNAAADLPFGGGKLVLAGNPKMPKDQKAQLIRALACALRNQDDYIFAPDMGVDEECMAWIRDEIGRVVALPRELGGIPLDEIGATGWGLRHAIEAALPYCDFELDGARVVVQGFGAVGKHAARFLVEEGAVLVAVSDSKGTIQNAKGLEIEQLLALKSEGKSVNQYSDAESLARETIIDVPCDIWIPAARPDVINEDNVGRLKTKLVAQGANIPLTAGAEKALHEKGVLCLPDFIANAGGVICAAMEYQGTHENAVFPTIETKIRRNTTLVLEAMKREQILPREAAMNLARTRVKRAMSFRRWLTFSSAPGFV